MAAASRRAVRVGRLIRQELARILSRDVQDPALALVGISRVEVTPDLQLARVFYRMLTSDEAETARLRRDAERGFGRAMGSVRRQLGQVLQLRSTPVLEFHYDEELDRVRRVEGLLEELAEERKERGDVPPGSGEAEDGDDGAADDETQN